MYGASNQAPAARAGLVVARLALLDWALTLLALFVVVPDTRAFWLVVVAHLASYLGYALGVGLAARAAGAPWTTMARTAARGAWELLKLVP